MAGLDPTIERAIEFPPEYHQAGVNILSYFSTYLKQKYPDTEATVTIKQDGLKVTMQIETPEGEVDRVEEALDEFGLIVKGDTKPADVMSNEAHILRLEYELNIARMRIENDQKLIGFAERQVDQLNLRVRSLEAQIESQMA